VGDELGMRRRRTKDEPRPDTRAPAAATGPLAARRTNGAAKPRCGQGTKRGTRTGKLAALDVGWRCAFHGPNDDVSLEEAGPNRHKSRVLGRNRPVFAEIHAETLPATMVRPKLSNFGKAPLKKLAMDRKSS